MAITYPLLKGLLKSVLNVMRIRSRSRVCKLTTGILCVVLLVHLAWKRNHAITGHLAVDNDRREVVGGENLSHPGPGDGTDLSKPLLRWTPTSTRPSSASAREPHLVAGSPLGEQQSTVGMVMDTTRVKISPKNPVVLEGHPVRLTCVVMQTLRNNASAAPYLTLQFPPMETKYRRSIRLQLRPGGCGLVGGGCGYKKSRYGMNLHTEAAVFIVVVWY